MASLQATTTTHRRFVLEHAIPAITNTTQRKTNPLENETIHDTLVMEGEVARLPNDPRLGGLRRRHNRADPDPFHEGNNNENGENQDWYVHPREERVDNHNNDDAGDNNDEEDAVRTPPTSIPTSTSYLLSPFSGSIGVGVFRISKWYCYVSILSALLAIVVAPISIHRIEHHSWTTTVYRVVEGYNKNNDDNNNNNSPILSTKTLGGKKDVGARSVEVKKIITHAAAVGIATSRQREMEESSSNFAAACGDRDNKEPRKRRRRPAAASTSSSTSSSTSTSTSTEGQQQCTDGESNEQKLSQAEDTGFPEAKESSSSSLLASAKAKTSAGKRNGNNNKNGNNKNGNGNGNVNKNKIPVSRLKYWVEQTNEHVEETSTDTIRSKNKKKQRKISAERKPWWKGPFQNIKDTANEKPTGNKDGSCDNDDSGRGALPDHYRLGNDDDSAHLDQNEAKENKDWKWIDPVFVTRDSFPDMVTSIIDKILKSTIRLCIITNFMLAMTYLLHSAVSAWFLSYSGSSDGTNNGGAMRRQQNTRIEDNPTLLVGDWTFASSSAATGAREQMGAFLIFKLLLISAVVAPDTLDLLILLTWFTLLGCLRGLDHLAHSTNTHLTAMGQPPEKGVVQLLFWVLACDLVAAGSCVALFHTAGLGMVLLLTCDCALLGADVVSHILKYYQCVLENSHATIIRGLEECQLELQLYRVNGDGNGNGDDDDNNNVNNEHEREEEEIVPNILEVAMTPTEVQQESERLDREMEGLELIHSRRLSILDTGIFGLEMACHTLTVAHFCHIWSLNGVQFTLIDGILALHLHSAISSTCKKLERRRNVHNIARDLQGQFPNATEEELKKASTAGDVCCICLGSMTTGGNVKKIHCGHLYHTHCLIEIIERAQNLQLAKCPLCRAPLVDGSHPVTAPFPTNGNNGINDNQQRSIPIAPPIDIQEANQIAAIEMAAAVGGDGDGGRDMILAEGERALFRFSTEGILPVWMPVPAFSFEVVRRPTLGAQRAGQPQNEQIQPAVPIPVQPIYIDASNQRGAHPEPETDIQIHALQQQHPQQQQENELPFFRRVLMLTGLMPMSPEEEARALGQLVDMFPQYDRSDLARELRDRGSIEAVTEAILMGNFRGVPRG